MRHTSSVTSVSWIPSEAIPGPMKIPFSLGIGHYDQPLPDRLDDLMAWRDADMFRFANRLEAWIEVDGDGTISGHGYSGGGLIGSTTMRLGPASTTFAAMSFPDLQGEPEVGDGWVRFRQTVGGRTGAPMPRTVRRKPFVQYAAPTVWTTLELTLHADGRAEGRLVGASPFPRHWVYDDDGELTAKSGLTDFNAWSKRCFGDHSPWGDVDSPAVVAEAETALERVLSQSIMKRGKKPRVRALAEGDELTRQGEDGRELFLLLDGVLDVVVDGELVAELGPGAVGGERALLGEGYRTATLRARTAGRVALVTADLVDVDHLRELAESHRREEAS
jgi:hypothetical protein